MYIKRQGSALISSVIILSVLSMLGAMYYKMTKYNIQLETLNYNHNDRYNFNKDENDVIYEYMKKININMKEKDGEDVDKYLKSINSEKIGRYEMRYNPYEHDYILLYYGLDDYKKYTVVHYSIAENKIMLVPSLVFNENDIRFIKEWEGGK